MTVACRWYRSRSFWFGLVGLVMLLGWWGNRSVHFNLFWNTTRHTTYAFSAGQTSISFIFADYSAVASFGGAPAAGWEFHRVSGAGRGTPPLLFIAPVRWHDLSAGAVTGGRISIAVWFIVALYVVAWYLGMIYWLRRKHRLMTNPLNPV